ncbi:PREDICTED: uncharacterized protein LOC109593729 [Amphimedon queenslandica]|uniref:CATSPERG C-terminal domain-containing protein n=1 Tax=Amphimedon queenslandica TaxID=400682 RepID=A0A1X7VLB8_AMPQE|nr:PREDICTED: uncharacterized protein LOC109593729 [Amphimedon queenslandica]|eukprot:XP_019864290.1 PREDICTED: uncharacterized protein LOC109593729 [Amphimedon queenslandica]
MFFVLYSILSAYKRNLFILLLFNVAPFLYCRILTAGQELVGESCYFRTTFVNQTHFHLSVQCWNETDIVPLKRPLILPVNVSPILHIQQTPSWKRLTSVSGRHLVTRVNRLLDNGTWVVSVDQSTNLSCISVKTITLTDISVTIDGSSDARCWDFLIDNANQTDLIQLPPCIPLHSNSSFNNTVLYWNPLKNISCARSDGVDFVPLSVYSSFAMGVFVIGNGMLYSLSNKGIFYFISFPPGIIVTNFSLFEDKGQYVFFTRNDSIQDSYKIWFGMTESKEVFLIYPSRALEFILNLYSISLMNISSIYWDQYNDFVMQTHSNISIPIPLFSMFEEAVVNFSLTHDPSSLFQSPQSLSPHHRLINNFTKSPPCPFTSALIQSPICTKYTRTSFVIDENLTDQFGKYTRSYSNCSSQISELPLVVYLSRGDSFEFTVEYFLNNFDKTSLFFSLTSSPPNVIQTTLISSWSPMTNSKLVKVRLREWLQYEEAQQVMSGETLFKTRVVLKTLGSEMFCAQEKLQEQIFVPGIFHLSVRVGCPPGLSLIYDHLESTRDQDHYCDLSDPDNCLYYNNEFYPVFKLKDSVTGLNEKYTGKYNLLAIAGGTSRENMAAFSQSNIELLLWTSLDEKSNGTAFETSRNGIRWSEYWSNIPGTPQYYLRLEATNKGTNDSYCLFTVQFIVHIHGIAPTRVYSVISVIIFVLLFLSAFIVGFGIWLCRDKVARRQ